MRNTALLLIITILLISCFPVIAEEQHNFVFRDDITWGMSKEDVISNEDSIYNDYNSNEHEFSLISYMSIPISKYTGDLNYFFLDEKLVTALYDIQSYEINKTLEYLQIALSSLYGDKTNTTGRDFVQIIQRISPTFTENKTEKDFFLCEWKLEDNTRIFLSHEYNNQYLIEITYVSPQLYESTVINTTGL